MIKKKIVKILKFLLPTQLFNSVRDRYLDLRYWFEIGRFFKKVETIKIIRKNGKNNFLVKIDPNNGYVDGFIYKYKYWDEHVAGVLESFLGEGAVFVDVGANIGYFSLLAASLSKKNRIIAFEPIPRLLEQFSASIALNNFENIEVHNFALGNENSKKLLYSENANNIGASTLSPLKHQSDATEYQVSVKKGGEILLSQKRIDLIKIDVEGYEWEVLDGLNRVLVEKRPSLIIEYSPKFYINERADNGQKIIDLLFSLGYIVKDLKTGKEYNSAEEWFSKVDQNIYQTDILAVFKEKNL